MAAFNKFEDIQAWQKAGVLTKIIYQLTKESEFSKDYDLRNQIRRSSISIMANIAEGQGRRPDKDFANLLNISVVSISEIKSHIYIALDLEYINQTIFDNIYQKLDEVGKIVFALCGHLRKT